MMAPPIQSPLSLLPGLMASLAVAAAALVLHRLEATALARAPFDAMVIAIVLGASVRALWTPGERFSAGIDFAARRVLEVAVALLGASLGIDALAAMGLRTVLVIGAVVMLAMAGGFALARACGLEWRLAVLIAAGNAICGNSAIAAVAPVIHARPGDVAAAIAFTAVLGVLAVLGLPLFGDVLGMAARDYGFLAGLSVYAVPQVLAATAGAGALALQVGTLVKLTRVLMLGPLVFVLALIMRPLLPAHGPRPPLLPWFIIAFGALALLRWLGIVPAAWVPVLAESAKGLSLVAMAALGLGTDLRAVAGVGARVILAATLAFIVLLALALLALRVI